MVAPWLPDWVPPSVFDKAGSDPVLRDRLWELDRFARMPIDEFQEEWESADADSVWDWSNNGCSDGGLATGDSFGCVRHDFVYRNNKKIDAEFGLGGALLDSAAGLKRVADSVLNGDVDSDRWIPAMGNLTDFGLEIGGGSAFEKPYSDVEYDTLWGDVSNAVLPRSEVGRVCGGNAGCVWILSMRSP
jgi:hypothetical protein